MRSLRQRLTAVGLALAIGGMTACGSDGGDGGTDPGPNPAIAISLSKTSLTIQQGGNDNLTASISRSGGFTGTVNVVTEGAPAGVTAAVSNVSTSGGTTTGTVTVSVAASVAPGTYNLTVRASGSGVADVTQAVSLTVTAAPSIGLSLSSATASIDQSASGTVTVTINRTNFTGNVTLALEGAPTGVTGTFAPNATGGNTSTLTLQVGAAVAPGPYNLTVRATGTGVTDATAPIQLTVTPPPSFTIANIAPNPISIGQNGNGNVTVTFTRTNFTGNINLSLENAPAGVTGTFTPTAVTATTSTLQLQVGAAVTTGNYTLTVRAQAQGQTDRTATFTLTVTGTVQGSYTLTTTPATQTTVQQGGNTNVTVNVNRIGGFTGSVALAVTGAPAGLTAQLNPTSTTGATSTLALSASGGLGVGNYQLTITGTTAGLANQTAQLTVNVTPASSGGNVTLNYSACDLQERPIWAAYQDGNGPWTRVVGSGDVYSFNVVSGRGGFAIVTSSAPGSSAIAIQYYSQAELQAITAQGLCPPSPATKNLTATVANVAAGQLATLSLGGGSGSVVGPGTTVNLTGVASGTYDLFGYSRSLLGAGAGDRLVIRRGINTAALANGASIGAPLDFTGAESRVPAAATMTLTNILGGESITHGVFYQSGASCDVSGLYFGSQSNTSTFTAYGVPAASQLAGETHGLSVQAATGLTSFRSVLEYFSAMTARNIALPNNLPAITPSVLGGPYKRLRFQFTLPNDLDASTTVGYTDAGSAKAVLMSATRAGYLGGFAVDLSMPDFSGLAGWDNTWAPAAPTTVDWSATGAGAAVTNLCTSGRIVSSTRIGTA